MKKEYSSPMMNLWDFEVSNNLLDISVPKNNNLDDSQNSEKVKRITIINMDSDDDW